MAKTVSEAEARTDIDELLDWIRANKETVIVQDSGTTAFAIVPGDIYAKLEELGDQDDKLVALTRIRTLRESIQSRSEPLSEDQAMEFANELVRDAIDSLVERGALTYRD